MYLSRLGHLLRECRQQDPARRRCRRGAGMVRCTR
jgi:hypothetical protein